MKPKFVLQGAVTKLYWYGFYSNRHWASDILDAKRFDTELEAEAFLENNYSEVEGMIITIIKIYCE